MYQKDYILRMIEMMADFIRAVLALIGKREIDQATHMVENAYVDFLKQEAAFFLSIPAESLTEKLLKEHNFTHGHLEVLAELMLLEAELYIASNKPDQATDYLKRAHGLFYYLLNHSGTYSPVYESRLSDIERKMLTRDNSE